MSKPKYYIGKSGNKYAYDEYINGSTGQCARFKALPFNDYPYGIEYEARKSWVKLTPLKENPYL